METDRFFESRDVKIRQDNHKNKLKIKGQNSFMKNLNVHQNNNANLQKNKLKWKSKGCNIIDQYFHSLDLTRSNDTIIAVVKSFEKVEKWSIHHNLRYFQQSISFIILSLMIWKIMFLPNFNFTAIIFLPLFYKSVVTV